MSTPLFPFPRFFFRERPASRGEKGGYMRIKPKNPKVLRARRIIVGGVALAAVLFVLLRPNTDSSLSTEESAPMPETAATPVPEAEDAQGELNWQYPPAGSIIPIFRTRKRSATRNSPDFPTGGICS